MSGGAQSGGSSVALTGTYRVAVSSCSPVAEGSRPFLASFVDLVPICRLFMLPLQLHFLRFFSPLSDSQSKLIPFSQVIEVLCAAWTSPVRLLDQKPFLPPPPPPLSLELTSVASQSGWGATLLPHRVSDTWSLEESLVLINSLELRAVFLALKCLEVYVSGQSLLVRSDNATIVSYINFQGGISPPLSLSFSNRAVVWEWCFQRAIHLSAAHFPGVDYLVADFLFRGKFLPSEWSLNSFSFSEVLPGFSSLSGDRSVCVHHQFLTSQVLYPLQGSKGLEGGHTLLLVVRSSMNLE